jgi:hypothetical protein
MMVDGKGPVTAAKHANNRAGATRLTLCRPAGQVENTVQPCSLQSAVATDRMLPHSKSQMILRMGVRGVLPQNRIDVASPKSIGRSSN